MADRPSPFESPRALGASHATRPPSAPGSAPANSRATAASREAGSAPAARAPLADVLLVEDDTAQRELLTEILRDEGYAVRAEPTAELGLERLAEAPADLVLSDWRLPGMDGMQLFEAVEQRYPGTAFVIITAYGTIARAVEAVRRGADDYLAKPFERHALLMAVERTLRARRLVAENERLHAELSKRDRLVDLVGRAPCMLELYRVVERVADSDAGVLLHGEGGTGKELAARALHALSARRDGPFVVVNCSAIPTEDAETAFFGGDGRSPFEAARGGTLFLDEVAQLPAALQPRLASLLARRDDASAERESAAPASAERAPRDGPDRALDVRLVAATSRDLEAEARDGGFREDLYYRLAVVSLSMPPLRERREDVPILIDYFLDRATERHGRPRPRLSSAVMRRLLDYAWPGNVRELENTLERLVLLADEDHPVTTDELPDSFSCRGDDSTRFELPPEGLSWDAHERDLLRQALEHTRGNRTRAAALLGMPYKAFLYRLEKHGLKPSSTG